MSRPTNEDTVLDDAEVITADPDTTHKNYDRFSEDALEGTFFSSDFPGVEVVRRRGQPRLAVPYHPALEPLGQKREAYYQQKLLLGLPWRCPDKPTSHEDGSVEWHFRWDPPLPSELRGGVVLVAREFAVGRDEVSFEGLCHEIDDALSSFEYSLVCQCCALVYGEEKCPACKNAIGFHHCHHPDRDTDKLLWRKGTLFADKLDVQRCLNNLSKKGCPIHVLQQKADEYVLQQHIDMDMANRIMRLIESERGRRERVVNDMDTGDGAPDQGASADRNRSVEKLSRAQLVAELEDREAKLSTGSADGVETDQSRLYQ
jgi:hypothetical protein